MNIKFNQITAYMLILSSGNLFFIQSAKAAELPIQDKIIENYRISTGDVISITVLNHPEFTLNAQILPDGTFSFPIIGKVKAQGKTREDLSREIASALKEKKQLVRPFVTVNVVQRDIQEVTVMGAVRGAGKLTLKDNWTVLDALGAAGGLGNSSTSTDRYEFYRADLFRDTQVIPLDLAKVYANNPDKNIALKNGDKIYVVTRPRSEITITVIGEIANGHGGTVELPKDFSLITLLNDLGGVSESAALSKATILRDSKVIKLDLRGYKKGKIENGIFLVGGDVLTIPRIEERYKINGMVAVPGEQDYPDDRTLTLFDALTKAKIPSTGADLKKVGVTRIENRITTTQIYDIDKMLKGDRSQDIEIRPGDEIYVPALDANRKLGVRDYLNYLTIIPSLFFLLRGR